VPDSGPDVAVDGPADAADDALEDDATDSHATDAPCGLMPDANGMWPLPECPAEPCDFCHPTATCIPPCAASGCMRCTQGAWVQEAWDCFCDDAG
jgi:hypothetical protein